MLYALLFLGGCSKKDEIPKPISFELEKTILGKWDVSNNTATPFEREEVIIHSVVFNSDKSFKINYSDGTIEGKYKVDSETELTLQNVGKLTKTSISNNTLNTNISLTNISVQSVITNR